MAIDSHPITGSEAPPSQEPFRLTGPVPLNQALEGWYDRPLKHLPDDLRQRLEDERFPVPWDSLSADKRRDLARHLDHENDPTTEAERTYWFEFFIRRDELKAQLSQWEQASADSVSELATRDRKIHELREELARMDVKLRNARGDYLPRREVAAKADDAPESGTQADYVAYPKALHFLAGSLRATAEEMAAWVWFGPEEGGLAAYTHANELSPPPRFHFGLFVGDLDYIEPLMACWFRRDDLLAFKPSERYISGAQLIHRWAKQPGIRPAAYIRAKISESQLSDMHPTCGLTQGGYPDDAKLPPLEAGLYPLSEIESIESEEFGPLSLEVAAPLSAPPDPHPLPENRVTQSEPDKGSPGWRRQNARDAANAKHDKPGGSRDRQRRIREIWASGKYDTRTRCAEEESAALGMALSTAVKALRNQPEPQRSGKG